MRDYKNKVENLHKAGLILDEIICKLREIMELNLDAFTHEYILDSLVNDINAERSRYKLRTFPGVKIRE